MEESEYVDPHPLFEEEEKGEKQVYFTLLSTYLSWLPLTLSFSLSRSLILVLVVILLLYSSLFQKINRGAEAKLWLQSHSLSLSKFDNMVEEEIEKESGRAKKKKKKVGEEREERERISSFIFEEESGVELEVVALSSLL